jgi:hypothetical protein
LHRDESTPLINNSNRLLKFCSPLKMIGVMPTRKAVAATRPDAVRTSSLTGSRPGTGLFLNAACWYYSTINAGGTAFGGEAEDVPSCWNKWVYSIEV